MPLADFKPAIKQPTQAELPKVQPDNYKGIVNDDKFHDLHKLTAFTEGYPMTVTYYGQVLGEDNDPREIDIAQAGAYQQYYKIVNMDIRVEQPLSMNHDDNRQFSTITGVANIYPDVRPNTYDYMVLSTTRGRPGLFRITNVTRMSMQRDSVFKVEYQMVGYADTTDALAQLNNLNHKVIKTLYFNKDRLAEGLSPLLSEDTNNFLNDMATQASQIKDYYFSTFFNPSFQTLTLPGQCPTVYDKFLTDYLLKLVVVDDHENIIKVRQLGSNEDRYMKQPQFWSVIEERNPLFLSQCNKHMGIVNRRAFAGNFYIAGARMSTIDAYVYPRDVDNTALSCGDQIPMQACVGLQDTTGPGGPVSAAPNDPRNQYKTEDGTNMTIYNYTLADITYVLSEKFYSNLPGQCLLEKVAWDYLRGAMLQMAELAALVKAYYTLTRLEQFYYGPLLLTFMLDAKTTQYS